MNIVYLTQATNIATLFLPIAYAFREDNEQHTQKLVSPESLSPIKNFSSDALQVFMDAGFNAELFPTKDLSSQLNENKMLTFYYAFRNYFEEYRPDVLFVGYEIGPEATAVVAARDLNVLTVHIQHGLWGRNKLSGNYLDNKRTDANNISIKLNKKGLLNGFGDNLRTRLSTVLRNIRKQDRANDLSEMDQRLIDNFSTRDNYRLSADLFFVPSSYYKKQTEEERPDYPADRVIPVGYLKYDTVFRKEITRNQLAEKYRLNVGSNWVIYLYSPFHLLRPGAYDICFPPDEAVYDALSESAKYIENTQFLILSHPNWTHHDEKLMNFLSGKAKQFDVRCAVAADDHFFIYKEAALIWGVKSATMTEAAMETTPVIRQNYVLKSVYDPVQIDFGGVISVFDRDHLPLILSELFSESDKSLMLKGKRRLASLVLGETDGKAGFRVVQKVKAMVH